MRPLQIVGKVRVVYAGCGVNALSVLQDFANSTYCRKYVGLISVAHQAVLSLLSVSRESGPLLSRDKRNCAAGDHGIGQFTVPTLSSGEGNKSGILPQSFTAQADSFCFSRTFKRIVSASAAPLTRIVSASALAAASLLSASASA